MKARKSWAMAYCGMAAALSVALMLLGAVVPVLMFIAPAVASLLIATVCVECGKTMALTAYGAVSLLSLLFVPDKEVALVFVFLLGYYPLVKPRFERILSLIHISAGRCRPGPQPRKDPCHVGPGAGRRDPVYQGLQDHGGLASTTNDATTLGLLWLLDLSDAIGSTCCSL